MLQRYNLRTYIKCEKSDTLDNEIVLEEHNLLNFVYFWHHTKIYKGNR